MVVKLDLKDKRILWELDSNSRQTLSEIAKKVRLSKETVYYRIKNLEDKKIITGYTLLVSLAKLGLMQAKIMIKLQNTNKETKQKIIDYLKNHNNTNWVGTCNGSYGLMVGFVVKDLSEFYKIKNKFFERYSQYFLLNDVSIMIDAQIYGRKYLLNKISKTKHYMGKPEKIKLDKLDLNILKLLAKNTRLRIIELAKNLSTTPRIIAYRIKQLEKNKVIQKYTISINHELLGISFFKSFISIRKDKEKMLSYLENHKKCVHNVEVIAEWNLEPEFEVYSNEEYYNILENIEETFGDSVKTINTILISKEYKFELLPKVVF